MHRFINFIKALSLVLFVFSDLPAQEQYLLVIDVQPVFYVNTKLASEADSMISNINRLIAKMDPEKVIYVKATMNVLSISGKGIRAVPVDPAPELDGKLKKVNNVVFTKKQGDAFTCDELQKYIADRGANNFIITGLMAEKCIYKTSLGGIQRGFMITIAPEAIMAKSLKIKSRTMRKMESQGMHVIPLSHLGSKK